MRNLGDITKINGAEVPVVDVVIGGSPCQDLSVAGKRAGRIKKHLTNGTGEQNEKQRNVRPCERNKR